MVRRTGPTPRPGYTMIELMVVILIISVLAALTTAAVIQVSKSGKRVSAVNEISQLDIVLTKFKQDFGFYPPSHVVDTSTGALRRFKVPTRTDVPEFFLLKKMFPRWNPPTDGSGNITGGIDLPGQQLDPNRTLVYFLSGPAQTGWDPNGPIAASASAANKKGPYFEFPSNRLLNGRFLDPWGTPYAYFSSNGGNDSYDPRAQFPWDTDPAPNTYTPTPIPLSAQTFSKETTDQSFVAHPYRGANSKWLNPGKVQIISAGQDMAFGAGSYPTGQPAPNDIRNWVPGAAGTEYMSTAGVGGVNFGYDDIANFNSSANLGETGSN